MPPAADVGIFGGSGFSTLLDGAETVEVETPYGAPSAPVSIVEVGGQRVAFLPRHGARHELPPHRIPYRANLWAMRELGVRRIVGPCASGALRPDLRLGEFVVCDQFVDRTSGRADTFYDGPETTHVSAADPLLPRAAEAPPRRRGRARRVGPGRRHGRGDPGPAVLATRAESRWFRELGGDVVNMTAYPEGHLARELELCYATIAMVTDYDAGADGHEPVTADQVLEVFRENNERLRELLLAVVPRIGPQPEDVCSTALRGARV